MLKHTFPSSALKTIYHSLIYPYYNCCNIILGCATSTYIEPLILLQKKCIRIISKSGFFEHTESLYSNDKIIRVNKIYDYNCSKFMHQCYNNNVYLHFRNKLFKNSVYHNYETRNINLLKSPLVRLHTFSNAFLTNGI